MSLLRKYQNLIFYSFYKNTKTVPTRIQYAPKLLDHSYSFEGIMPIVDMDNLKIGSLRQS